MKLTKVRQVKTPSRGTSNSAGLDFYLPDDFQAMYLDPGKSINVPSGIKMIIPNGLAGIFFNKSGIAIKGLMVGACVVDSDYRGEVHLNIHNVGNANVRLEPGQKITQMVMLPYESLTPQVITNEDYAKDANTERGEGGFGSTGAS